LQVQFERKSKMGEAKQQVAPNMLVINDKFLYENPLA
jgi:hypothetical protein